HANARTQQHFHPPFAPPPDGQHHRVETHGPLDVIPAALACRRAELHPADAQMPALSDALVVEKLELHERSSRRRSAMTAMSAQAMAKRGSIGSSTCSRSRSKTRRKR